MPVTSGEELLTSELRHIHSAEKLLSRALPRLAKLVSSEELQEKLRERLEEGREILEAVEEELENLQVSVGRGKNVAAEGLIEDANQLAQEIEDEDVLDAALIGALQKVQHYCLAAWGTTAAFARAMEQESLVETMERALENGRRFDEELTQIAEEDVNPAVFDLEMEESETEKGQEEESSSRRSERRNREQQQETPRRARSSSQRAKGSSRDASRSKGSEASASGRSGGSRSSRRETDADLSAREYRDSKGRIRHHTRSYMERHGRG